MTDQIKQRVQAQFGAHAQNYLTSQSHAQGDGLQELPPVAGLTGTESVLDVATAVGHTALALAPHAGHVIGLDLTPQMLQVAREQAAARSITNISFEQGDAEALPFPDSRFDVVTCRIAAHHFPNPARFCHEAARVLRPGGRLVVIDNVAPEDDQLDQFINSLEQLRDPSHVRCLKVSEWERQMGEAGLRFELVSRFSSARDVAQWLQMAGASEAVGAEVRDRLAQASQPARAHFAITPDSFVLHKATMVGRK